MTDIAIAKAPDLSNEDRLGMFRRMLLCRMFEERVYYLFLQGRMPGTIHQAQGQEAARSASARRLQPGDMITSTHRPHEHAVARGVPVNSLMAELFAKSTGCCQARAARCTRRHRLRHAARHRHRRRRHSARGRVALAFKYRKTGDIVACFFGDGATNIGAFHEGVNIAAIWDLPVVFVCENNRYGASTAIEKVTRVPRHARSRRGLRHSRPHRRWQRRGGCLLGDAGSRPAGPRRRGPHVTGNREPTGSRAIRAAIPGIIVPKDEVAYWKARDPLTRYEAFLTGEGILSSGEAERHQGIVSAELDAAVAFAEASPSPLPEDCLKDVYAA